MTPSLRFACFVLIAGSSVLADEGMWTFDNPPLKRLQDKYNFTPSKEWLDHIRLSSVRLSDGGSGSFVSPHGLLLTNHHVARAQLQNLSTAQKDYIKDGFYAASQSGERKSPNLEVNVLISMEDVTKRIQAALKPGQTDQESFAARRAATAEIERDSLKATGLRSDVVSLYQGGEYWLYRYKKYTDVRLVFAPEQQIAFFGGDPDNFTYPRYDLDMAIYRVYENDKPIENGQFLKWNAKGAADGELVFLSGNPGTTQRLATLPQLSSDRDDVFPKVIASMQDRIRLLQDYSKRGPEQARQAGSMIFGLQNSVKAITGEEQGLLDKSVIAKKQKEEEEFKALVRANADWGKQYGGAWDAIASAEAKARPRVDQQLFRGFDSSLYQMALQIVRYVAEVKKPDGVRLPGFHEAQLESARFRLFAPVPIYPELEQVRLQGSFDRALQHLGPEDPYLKTALDGRPSAQAAQALIQGTKLADVSVRKALIEGGESAVGSSTDPMIVLARKLDPIGREQIKWFEDNITSVVSKAGEQIGRARFLAYGKSTYPDATFTLRLAYGTVRGYPMNGTVAPHQTTLYGLYDRAAGFDFAGPWSLPSRYQEHKESLNLATPLNFVADVDSTGGNSGSPLVNRAGELVGLLFDGNIESLVGTFVYDPEKNRSVLVHSAVMIEALRKLYGAGALADEIQGRAR